MPGPLHNPFATRSIRPGAIAYWFADGATPALLVERFLASGCRGELIGPHGSGKSTLLAALALAFVSAGKSPHVIALHNSQRRIRRGQFPRRRLGTEDVLLVDGYEQLGWLGRWLLGRRCARSRCGLLVTAHSPAGFPLLYRTDVALAIAGWVIAELARDTPEMALEPAEAMRRVEARQGNLREVLFDLYDEYEARRRS
jgi:energy-coupling factor transporter ATP-binding protein EcfA2